jgi:membrane protein involved in colicin uptake
MKKQILIAITLGFTSFHATAESKNCTAGYDNIEHLGSCLGGVVDSSINALSSLPSDAKKWSSDQHQKAKQKLEEIKQNICNDNNPVKEVVVEKIVYVDRLVEVPAKALERRCVTNKKSDRFGNTSEVITCTEWK